MRELERIILLNIYFFSIGWEENGIQFLISGDYPARNNVLNGFPIKGNCGGGESGAITNSFLFISFVSFLFSI